jgi:hypothetical protein
MRVRKTDIVASTKRSPGIFFDMYEGWAQSDRVNSVNVASLQGWADGLRSLVEVVGADYIPPKASPGAPVSLIKFMAIKMGG